MSKVFIDCGANRGQSLEVFVKNWEDWSEYIIRCFEADPRPFEYLQGKVNQLSEQGRDIKAFQSAVWIEEGEIDFYQCTDGDFGSSLISNKKTGKLNKEPVVVPCFDLAKLLQTWTREDYIILKLDVEGAEYDILEHLISTRALDLVDILYLEFHNWKVNRTKEEDQLLLDHIHQEFPSLKVDTTSYHDLSFI